MLFECVYHNFANEKNQLSCDALNRKIEVIIAVVF